MWTKCEYREYAAHPLRYMDIVHQRRWKAKQKPQWHFTLFIEGCGSGNRNPKTKPNETKKIPQKKNVKLFKIKLINTTTDVYMGPSQPSYPRLGQFMAYHIIPVFITNWQPRPLLAPTIDSHASQVYVKFSFECQFPSQWFLIFFCECVTFIF